MAFVLYGAVSNLGSGKILCRCLTDKVRLPRDTPHDVSKESVMDKLALSILEKAPSKPSTKVSTYVADRSLAAHLWNNTDVCYLLIVTPAVDNGFVEQLWKLMDSEMRRCRMQGMTAQKYEAVLRNILMSCNRELDDVISKAKAMQPTAEDDIVIAPILAAYRYCKGEEKCTPKKLRKYIGLSVSVFFAGLAVVFAIISCPLK